MGTTATASIQPRRRLFVGLAAALLGALVLVGTMSGLADADRAHILGKTKKTPKPRCPQGCRAFGKVTGFQASTADARHPFRVRESGHLVGWSVDLGDASKRLYKCFADKTCKDEHGENQAGLDWGKPRARIAVLKKEKRSRYKLKRESPAVDLGPVLGGTPVFTLSNPLKVKEGDIVALSTPSWVLNLGKPPPSAQDRWVASRPGKKCADENFLREGSKPQQKVGSSRKYGCTYTERLLYWAYFVPSH
jgi:hypothetical protein